MKKSKINDEEKTIRQSKREEKKEHEEKIDKAKWDYIAAKVSFVSYFSLYANQH